MTPFAFGFTELRLNTKLLWDSTDISQITATAMVNYVAMAINHSDTLITPLSDTVSGSYLA